MYFAVPLKSATFPFVIIEAPSRAAAFAAAPAVAPLFGEVAAKKESDIVQYMLAVPPYQLPMLSAGALECLTNPKVDKVGYTKAGMTRELTVVGGWNAKTQKWTKINTEKTWAEDPPLCDVLDSLAHGFQAGALTHANFHEEAFTPGGWDRFCDELEGYEYRLTDDWWRSIFEKIVDGEGGSNDETASSLRDRLDEAEDSE